MLELRVSIVVADLVSGLTNLSSEYSLTISVVFVDSIPKAKVRRC